MICNFWSVVKAPLFDLVDVGLVLLFVGLFFTLKSRKQKIYQRLHFQPRITSTIRLDAIGSLTVYTGPMFCGKTTHLIDNVTRYADLSISCTPLVINHSADTRDISKVISSHGSSYKGLSHKITAISVDHLRNVDVKSYSVIGIDEAQFFDDLVECVTQWVRMGKHVYVSGLDSDFRGEKFGFIADLLPEADTFVKMQAVCEVCLKSGDTITPASFTSKHSGSSSAQIEVGGHDLYIPACRRHHPFKSRIDFVE